MRATVEARTHASMQTIHTNISKCGFDGKYPSNSRQIQRSSLKEARISQHQKVYRYINKYSEQTQPILMSMLTLFVYNYDKKRWNYLVSLNNGAFILWKLYSVAHNNPFYSLLLHIHPSVRPFIRLLWNVIIIQPTAKNIKTNSQLCRKCPF